MTSSDTKVPKRPLYDMFTALPPRYDLANRLITLGLDNRWRQQATLECAATRPEKVLDVGCGTGDLAVNISRMGRNNIEVIGVDYSRPMLDAAAGKAGALSGNRPSFVQGDAASLPFPDNCFDCAGISFAFRNLTYKNPLAKAFLAEVLRVLKPGGRFVAVESSQPESGVIRQLFRLYLRFYVYGMGWLVSGNKGAYRYLSESAARFYFPAEIKDLLLKAGFSGVTYRPLFFGAAGIHVAVK